MNISIGNKARLVLERLNLGDTFPYDENFLIGMADNFDVGMYKEDNDKNIYSISDSITLCCFLRWVEKQDDSFYTI